MDAESKSDAKPIPAVVDKEAMDLTGVTGDDIVPYILLGVCNRDGGLERVARGSVIIPGGRV